MKPPEAITMQLTHVLTRYRAVGVATALAVAAVFLSSPSAAQNMPTAGEAGAAPDDWLLAQRGPRWWPNSRPSPEPVQLRRREPTAAEAPLVERARRLVAAHPAKAFVLMDSDNVVFEQTVTPAQSSSLFFGFSMGKTVTAMAAGQAVCAGHLRLDTKAQEHVPGLAGKALGQATLRDLLMMASGAAEPNADSSIFTRAEQEAWNRGAIDLAEVVAQDRVATAARGFFGTYKPGEHFSYKTTDPLVVGLMVSAATGTPWAQWVQQAVLDPMGAENPGLVMTDRQGNGGTDAGVRIRLDDWMRFALWVKRTSLQKDCMGDFVRAALSPQISNRGTVATRKHGRLFGSYGYFTWTDNEMAPRSAWASGWGGQRIGWHRDNARMVITFSSVENWMPEIYALAKEWQALPGAVLQPMAPGGQPGAPGGSRSTQQISPSDAQILKDLNFK
jgi:CubicO group peptidase (beta-lactamase class C family)